MHLGVFAEDRCLWDVDDTGVICYSTDSSISPCFICHVHCQIDAVLWPLTWKTLEMFCVRCR